jgi:hypothetical protein
VERLGQVIVPGPVFEDIAQQVKLPGLARRPGQKAEERFGRARVRFLQVQVGNK